MHSRRAAEGVGGHHLHLQLADIFATHHASPEKTALSIKLIILDKSELIRTGLAYFLSQSAFSQQTASNQDSLTYVSPDFRTLLECSVVLAHNCGAEIIKHKLALSLLPTDISPFTAIEQMIQETVEEESTIDVEENETSKESFIANMAMLATLAKLNNAPSLEEYCKKTLDGNIMLRTIMVEMLEGLAPKARRILIKTFQQHPHLMALQIKQQVCL